MYIIQVSFKYNYRFSVNIQQLYCVHDFYCKIQELVVYFKFSVNLINYDEHCQKL